MELSWIKAAAPASPPHESRQLDSTKTWLPLDICDNYSSVRRHRDRRFLESLSCKVNGSGTSNEPDKIYDAADDDDTEEIIGNATTLSEAKQSDCLDEYTGEDEYVTPLVRIITPPKPPRPVDLVFPVCGSNDTALLADLTNTQELPSGRRITLATFPTKRTDKNLGSSDTATPESELKEKATEIELMTSEHTKGNTIVSPKPTTIREEPAIVTASHVTERLSMGDTKIVVRVPPSLAELPVLVLRDPKSEMLSLSLITDHGQCDNQTNHIVRVNPMDEPIHSVYRHRLPFDTLLPLKRRLFGTKRNEVERERLYHNSMSSEYRRRTHPHLHNYLDHFRLLRSSDKENNGFTNIIEQINV